MQKTAVAVLVTAVVFALAGYYVAGSRPPQATLLKHAHQYHDCRGKDCDITIKFVCVDAANASTCEPYADYELILVNAEHKMKFTIDPTTNYDFDPNDGIKFTSTNANGWLPCSPQAHNTKVFGCENHIPPGTASDAYKYQIHVQQMTIVDPWAVNY